jgi:hypothetical protein
MLNKDIESHLFIHFGLFLDVSCSHYERFFLIWNPLFYIYYILKVVNNVYVCFFIFMVLHTYFA